MIIDADFSSIDNGVWEEFDGSKFRIAHISNVKFQRALSRLQQPHLRKIQEGRMDPELNKRILAQAMSEGILLDWQDVKNKAGDQVPFSPKAAQAALMANVEFRDFVSDFATNIGHYRDEEVEELGNT